MKEQSAKIDPYDMGVASRLRAIRRQRKLTQQDVAARLGVSYQQLQKYETGANRISAGGVHRLSRIFDVPISAFFEGEDEKSGAVSDPAELELLRDFRGVPSPGLRKAIAGFIHAIQADGKGPSKSTAAGD